MSFENVLYLYSSQNKKSNTFVDTSVAGCNKYSPEELSGSLFALPAFQTLKNLYLYASTASSVELIKVPKSATVQEFCTNVWGVSPKFQKNGVEAVESNLFTLAFLVFGLAVILPGNKNFLWFINILWARIALIIIGCFMLQRSANPETKYSWNDVISGNFPT